jgi:hypothetical protein
MWDPEDDMKMNEQRRKALLENGSTNKANVNRSTSTGQRQQVNINRSTSTGQHQQVNINGATN